MQKFITIAGFIGITVTDRFIPNNQNLFSL